LDFNLVDFQSAAKLAKYLSPGNRAKLGLRIIPMLLSLTELNNSGGFQYFNWNILQMGQLFSFKLK
jgi:hypothetical protein